MHLLLFIYSRFAIVIQYYIFNFLKARHHIPSFLFHFSAPAEIPIFTGLLIWERKTISVLTYFGGERNCFAARLTSFSVLTRSCPRLLPIFLPCCLASRCSTSRQDPPFERRRCKIRGPDRDPEQEPPRRASRLRIRRGQGRLCRERR